MDFGRIQPRGHGPPVSPDSTCTRSEGRVRRFQNGVGPRTGTPIGTCFDGERSIRSEKTEELLTDRDQNPKDCDHGTYLTDRPSSFYQVSGYLMWYQSPAHVYSTLLRSHRDSVGHTAI